MTNEEAQAYVSKNNLRVIYLDATKDNLTPETGDVMIVGRGRNISRGVSFIEAVENFADLELLEQKKDRLRERMVKAELIK